MASPEYLRTLTARALGWVCISGDPAGITSELYGSRSKPLLPSVLGMAKDVGYCRVPHYEEGEGLLEVLNALGGQIVVICLAFPWEHVFWAFSSADVSWNACGATPEVAACKLLVAMSGLVDENTQKK